MADTTLDINHEDPELSESRAKRRESAGEMVFDRTVYTGIGFGVNEASSLWITDQFKYGKNLFENVPSLKNMGSWFSEEGYQRVSDMVAKIFKYKDTIGKTGEKISARAQGGNTLLMVTLISGGTLLILPMKWLEDHKSYWVKKANHMVDRLRGNTLTPEQVAARDAEVEQDIACAPRQSWPTILLGRTIAVMSSMTTGSVLVGTENNNKLMDWSEKTFAGSIQPEGQKKAFNRYARLISVETYSCAISSIVLEVMSKLFAKRSAHPHDPDICQNKAQAPVNTDEAKEEGDHHRAKLHSQKAMAAAEPLAMGL